MPVERLEGNKYRCKCDCGNETIVDGGNLRTKNTQSCGCLQREIASKTAGEINKGNYKDLSKDKFDRLKPLYIHHVEDGVPYWFCQCDCGNTKIVSRAYLVDGVTRSCGCLIKELSRENFIGIKGDTTMTNWGFLRETSEIAEKAGIDKDTGVCRTGLDKYLSVIFPETTDWIHDKAIGLLPDGTKSRKRPDYRSESLKLIVEIDGVPHYDNPENIRKDIESTKMYEKAGYKVIRIPYFIQLSNNAVKTLFGVDVDGTLFDESIPSMGIQEKNTPAFMCPYGIRRMAEEFKRFPEQYITNLNALRAFDDDDFLSGASLLENEYNNLEEA
jgi:hypothetical protein|nr:MAG TPA: Very-short-patch-repair endonuclease [Caudoviricetes sp.]